MAAGEVVYVVYGGEPELFLTRLVAGHFVGQDWIVITPLFDAFEGDVSRCRSTRTPPGTSPTRRGPLRSPRSR